MSNSLQPRGLQHTRLPCLSLFPEVCSKSCPFSRWWFPTISCSVAAFSSCTQSFLASWSFPMSRLFASGGQCIELLAAAAAAKLLQSCPTLCDLIDGSPPGFPVSGILQARTLEWLTISFSNAWKWKVKVKLLSRVQLLVTPWTATYQAPLSMGFSRQEYWSGVPLPSPIELLRMIKNKQTNKQKKTEVGTEILLNLPTIQQSSSISLSGTFSRSLWYQFRHYFQRYLILFLLISFYRCLYLLHGELTTVRL